MEKEHDLETGEEIREPRCAPRGAPPRENIYVDPRLIVAGVVHRETFGRRRWRIVRQRVPGNCHVVGHFVERIVQHILQGWDVLSKLAEGAEDICLNQSCRRDVGGVEYARCL